MRISFNQTTSANVADTNGYGYAARMCKESLRTLGHEVNWRDDTADVEINFIQPEKWHWSGVDYRIGYLPWESTKLHEGWVDQINNECDEIWTPSPVIAQWMVEDGVKLEPKVYEHGVDACWTPVKRSSEGDFRILHHGADALRKNSQDTINALFEVFSSDEAVELWLKAQLDFNSFHDNARIKIRNGKIPLDDLIALYHESHLLAYPSWGEGFGLAPLQAMATGMPVLVTRGWAPYQDFIPEYSLIDSTLEDSPWPPYHPGKMFKPDYDDFKDKLRWHYENRERALSDAEGIIDALVDKYNWLDLTEKAFAHLV